MSVADLLSQSRTAHDRYRRLSHDTKNRDLVGQGEAVRAALLARLEAHQLDPDQADPAWIADQQAMKGQSSSALVIFYGRYLSPSNAQELLAS